MLFKLPRQRAFLVADTQLYKRLCPSVRPSVGWSVGPLVSTSRKVWKCAFPPLPTRPQLMAVYPALFKYSLDRHFEIIYGVIFIFTLIALPLLPLRSTFITFIWTTFTFITFTFISCTFNFLYLYYLHYLYYLKYQATKVCWSLPRRHLYSVSE